MNKFKLLILGLGLNLNLPVLCTHAGGLGSIGSLDPEVIFLFKLSMDSKRSKGERLSREERSILRFVLAQEAQAKAEQEKVLRAAQKASADREQKEKKAQEKRDRQDFVRSVKSGVVRKPKGWSAI